MGKDKWHNRLHLVALENGIIGNFFSIMWKSLPTVHPEETVQVYSQSMTWLQEHHKILIFTSAVRYSYSEERTVHMQPAVSTPLSSHSFEPSTHYIDH